MWNLFQAWASEGLFPKGQKHFSRGETVVKFQFTSSKLIEKHFSTKKLIKISSNFKIQAEQDPPAPFRRPCFQDADVLKSSYNQGMTKRDILEWQTLFTVIQEFRMLMSSDWFPHRTNRPWPRAPRFWGPAQLLPRRLITKLNSL